MIMDTSENDSGFTTCNLSSDMSLNGARRISSKPECITAAKPRADSQPHSLLANLVLRKRLGATMSCWGDVTHGKNTKIPACDRTWSSFSRLNGTSCALLIRTAYRPYCTHLSSSIEYQHHIISISTNLSTTTALHQRTERA